MGDEITADSAAETISSTARRRQELAEFLRARRDAVRPEDVGLKRRGRRRVKGLRRYEVADLAAVSVTWYTWLEQGRHIRTTTEVLDSVSRALLLDEVSHEHLRRLAGAPIIDNELSAPSADGALRELVDELLPSPAALIDPTNELLAWNESYARLFSDPATLPPSRRNGLVIMLTELEHVLENWEEECRTAIAAFHAEAGKHPGDPRFAEVLELLNDESELFRDAWSAHEVRRFIGHEQIHIHPLAGRVRTHQMLLRPLGSPSLILMIFQLRDPESRRRVEELLATPAPNLEPALLDDAPTVVSSAAARASS